MITTAIETIRSVAGHAADHPPAPRAVPDHGRPPAATLAGLPPRAARILLRLLFTHTPDGSTLRILAQALTAFLPFLGLDWLPADPAAIRKPTDRVLARLDLLRQERAARARLRGAVARHRPARRAKPHRPPENRAAAALGLDWPDEPDDDLWHDLLDLTSQTLETFIAYGHQPGVRRCAELIEVLAEVFGEPRPAAA